MSRLTTRLSSLLALGLCAGLICSATPAQASNASLRAVIKSAVPGITRSQAKILSGLANYQKTHNLSSLISAIKSQDRELTKLETRVNAQSASSQKGAKGKADIILGLRYIIGSNVVIAAQLERKAHGKSISQAKIQASVTAAKKGNLDLSVGAKLLKA